MIKEVKWFHSDTAETIRFMWFCCFVHHCFILLIKPLSSLAWFPSYKVCVFSLILVCDCNSILERIVYFQGAPVVYVFIIAGQAGWVNRYFYLSFKKQELGLNNLHNPPYVLSHYGNHNL